MTKARAYADAVKRAEVMQISQSFYTVENAPVLATANPLGDLFIFGRTFPPAQAVRLAKWILENFEDEQ